MLLCKEPFLSFVMDEAVRQTGKAFVYDSAEGHEMVNPPDGMEVENWSGWLIPLDRITEEIQLPNEIVSEDDPFVWATWFQKDDGSIGIKFEPVEIFID